MKREKRLTRRERKAAEPPRPAPVASGVQDAPQAPPHIHCVACGRHLDPTFFDAPATAEYVRCSHGSVFATCSDCVGKARELLAEHDRSGKPVKVSTAWH